MKKSLTARESIYIALIFVNNQCPKLKAKACAKTNSSKNAENRQKRQNLDFDPRFQDIYSTHIQCRQ